MTKVEMLVAIKAGAKVRHRYFGEEESMTWTDSNMFKFEYGILCSESEFWRYRTDDFWETDWEIVK